MKNGSDITSLPPPFPLRPSLSPSADQSTRHAVRVLRMVHELHKAGYQKLRIWPALSPNGCFWRCYITSSDKVERDGYTFAIQRLRDGIDYVFYTTGDAKNYFSWEDKKEAGARELATTFIERFPDLIQRGVGFDWPYAGWMITIIGLSETHYPPVFTWDNVAGERVGPPEGLSPPSP